MLELAPGFQFDTGLTDIGTFSMTALNNGVVATPISGAAWLFGSGLLGLIGLSRRMKVA